MASQTLLPLTDKSKIYKDVNEFEWDMQKYWQQRYSIWSLYDQGIYMTEDAWFGVTPEAVAIQVSNDLETSVPPSKTTIIDLFAGVGGNSISFALSNRWTHVIAIEKDPSTLACGQRNAAIYGCDHLITWVNDDCFAYLKSHAPEIKKNETVIFGSPPWGGPGYKNEGVFDLSTMHPYSVQEIYGALGGMECALYLPRTSDLNQIAKLAPKGKKIECVQYCMEGAAKALVAYIPADENLISEETA